MVTKQRNYDLFAMGLAFKSITGYIFHMYSCRLKKEKRIRIPQFECVPLDLISESNVIEWIKRYWIWYWLHSAFKLYLLYNACMNNNDFCVFISCGWWQSYHFGLKSYDLTYFCKILFSNVWSNGVICLHI